MISEGDWPAAADAFVEALAGPPERHFLEEHLLGERCLILQPFNERRRKQNNRTPIFSERHLQNDKAQEGLRRLYEKFGAGKHRQEAAVFFFKGVVRAQLAAAEFVDTPPCYDEAFATYCIDAAASFRAFNSANVTRSTPFIPPQFQGEFSDKLHRMLGSAFDDNPPTAAAILSLCRLLLHFLGQPTVESRVVNTPVLLYSQSRNCGVVQRLTIAICKDAHACWYLDPLSLAFVTMDQVFMESAVRAWQQARRRRANQDPSYESVRVKIADSQVRAASFKGPSMGLALACSMRAALTGELLDENVAICGALTDDPTKLGTVEHLNEKIAAAASSNVSRVIVAAAQAEVARRIVSRLSHGIVEIIPADGFDQAYRHARQTPAAESEPAALHDSTLQVGGRIHLPAGDRIDATLWNDAHSTGYWANGDQHPTIHQDVNLPVEVMSAADARHVFARTAEQLRDTGLSSSHLIPSRSESGQGACAIRFIYDRPADEQPGDWQTLAEHQNRRRQAIRSRNVSEPASQASSPSFIGSGLPNEMFEILYFGIQLALALAELHRLQIVHGNLLPENVLLQRKDGRLLVVLKDHWLGQSPGAAKPPSPYGPPGESVADTGHDRYRDDCWSLGVILFELVCGRAPTDGEVHELSGRLSLRQVVEHDFSAAAAEAVPQALDELVRECLNPWSLLRPAAAAIARRLQLASLFDGDVLGAFADGIDCLIQAGQRLLMIQTDDFGELERCLEILASHPRPVRLQSDAISTAEVRYHLLVAEEERGLHGDVQLPWFPAEQLHAEMVAQSGRADQPPPTSDEVAHINARLIFDKLQEYYQRLGERSGHVPILLIRGVMKRRVDWWDYGLEAHRMLRNYQQSSGLAPVIIIADRHIAINTDISPLFVPLQQPPPTMAKLFEMVLGYGRQLDKAFSDELAVELAKGLYPCSRQEMSQAMRVCYLQRGRIDLTVLETRDLERKRRIGTRGVASYHPPAELASPSYIALPNSRIVGFEHTPTRNEVQQWVDKVKLSHGVGLPIPIPRFLLIQGETGSGKTTIAGALARWVDLPLVRVNTAACLRGFVGESEHALHETLADVAELRRAVVLLDNADATFHEESDGQSSVAATLGRMSGIFLHWADSFLSSGMIVIVTARLGARLPAQWRRRIQWRIDLPYPLGNKMADYRREVFASQFQARQLPTLAENKALMGQLAEQTDPDLRSTPLSAPAARHPQARTMRNHYSRLESPAEIADWINETLLLFADTSRGLDQQFWRDAVAGSARGGRK